MTSAVCSSVRALLGVHFSKIAEAESAGRAVKLSMSQTDNHKVVSPCVNVDIVKTPTCTAWALCGTPAAASPHQKHLQGLPKPNAGDIIGYTV